MFNVIRPVPCRMSGAEALFSYPRWRAEVNRRP